MQLRVNARSRSRVEAKRTFSRNALPIVSQPYLEDNQSCEHFTKPSICNTEGPGDVMSLSERKYHGVAHP